MGNNVLLSVLVSTYNSEKFFEGKLKDLIDQTIFDQTEIIIINSGSLENEEKIVKEYLDKYSNIKYEYTAERESIYKAWNRGIKLSTGTFITNANTDDRLKNNAFEVLINYLIENPNVALVYADQYITDLPNQTFEETKNYSKAKAYRAPDFDYFKQLDRGLVFSQPMWRADLHFKDDIWYDEQFEICGDYDFQLKVSQRYKIFHLPKFLGTFYLSPKKSNKSHNNFLQYIKEKNKISEPYVRNHIDSLNDNEIKNLILKGFRNYFRFPLPVFYIWKSFQIKINPSAIYRQYFFSIEFVFFITILAHLKLGDEKKAIKSINGFLRYSKSNRIENLIKEISK